MSAVRNSKFQTTQEPIKLLDFTFRTAHEYSQILSDIKATYKSFIHEIFKSPHQFQVYIVIYLTVTNTLLGICFTLIVITACSQIA